MGNYRNSPYIGSVSEAGTLGQNRLKYVLASHQGWRSTMEDRHIICGFKTPSENPITKKKSLFRRISGIRLKGKKRIGDTPGHPDKMWHILGVFDGHGGKEVAEQANWILPGIITRFVQDIQNTSPEEIMKILDVVFLQADQEIRGVIEKPNQSGTPGSTAIIALLSPIHVPNKGFLLFLGGVGDSLAFLASAQGKIKFKSILHTVENQSEISRIGRAGGGVLGNKVEGTLSLTRAFGYYHLKHRQDRGSPEPIISALPDFILAFAQPGDFLVLMCDAIWKSVPAEEIARRVSGGLKSGKSLTAIVDKLIKNCIATEAGFGPGCENMTIIVGTFSGNE